MAITWGKWQTAGWFSAKRIDNSITLDGDLSSSATTIPVTGDISGLATSGYLQIDDEYCSYTGKTASSFTGVSRGHANTLAATHTSGATVYSITRTARSGTTPDYFDDDADVGDCLYFLAPTYSAWTSFKGLRFNVGTPRDGTVTLVWEYSYYTSSTDKGWTTLPTVTDNTNGFTTTGSNDVSWNNGGIDSDKRWISVSAPFGGTTGRYVRVRISAVTAAITEGGKNQTTAVQQDRDVIVIDSGTEAAPNEVTDLYDADVADSWGIVTRSGNSSRYRYECARPIYIDTNGALRLKDCDFAFVVKYLYGHIETVRFISNTTSFFIVGTLNSTAHSANESILSGISLVVGYSGCQGWRHYGGEMYGGTFVSMGPYIFHEVVWHSANYVGTYNGIRMRDVTIYNIGDGFLVPTGSGATLQAKGLKFYNGSYAIRTSQTAEGDTYLYDIEAYDVTPFKTWWPNSGTHNVWIRGYIADDNNVLYAAGMGGAGAKVIWWFQQPFELKVIDTIGNAIDDATVVITDAKESEVGSFTTGGIFLDTSNIPDSSERYSLSSQPTQAVKLNITIAGISVGTASVSITGTDIQDLAITETIKLSSGAGIYTTSNEFKTVDVSGILVTNCSGGTIKVHMDGRIYTRYLTKKSVEVQKEDSSGIVTNPDRHVFYTPHTLTISKSGYITQTHKITMDEKKDLVFTLEQVKFLNYSKRGSINSQ